MDDARAAGRTEKPVEPTFEARADAEEESQDASLPGFSLLGEPILRGRNATLSPTMSDDERTSSLSVRRGSSMDRLKVKMQY
eukprot:COSAG04_NODE_17560_length_466_cov_0.632153_2_plen_81_part_01